MGMYRYIGCTCCTYNNREYKDSTEHVTARNLSLPMGFAPDDSRVTTDSLNIGPLCSILLWCVQSHTVTRERTERGTTGYTCRIQSRCIGSAVVQHSLISYRFHVKKYRITYNYLPCCHSYDGIISRRMAPDDNA